MNEHLHACGHPCACALPADPLCVQHALVTAQLVDRQAIWNARWPASNPHPTYTDIPPVYLTTNPPPII